MALTLPSPTPQILDSLFGILCNYKPSLCNNILASLFGPDNNLNTSRLDVYATHWPDSTSVQNIIHWWEIKFRQLMKFFEKNAWYSTFRSLSHFCRIQNARSGKFADFYGVEYDPHNIPCPVAVYYGTSDYLAVPQDVQQLISRLPVVADSAEVTGFAHLDFVWSPTAYNTFYRKLLALLEKYNSPHFFAGEMHRKSH